MFNNFSPIRWLRAFSWQISSNLIGKCRVQSPPSTYQPLHCPLRSRHVNNPDPPRNPADGSHFPSLQKVTNQQTPLHSQETRPEAEALNKIQIFQLPSQLIQNPLVTLTRTLTQFARKKQKIKPCYCFKVSSFLFPSFSFSQMQKGTR